MAEAEVTISTCVAGVFSLLLVKYLIFGIVIVCERLRGCKRRHSYLHVDSLMRLISKGMVNGGGTPIAVKGVRVTPRRQYSRQTTDDPEGNQEGEIIDWVNPTVAGNAGVVKNKTNL